MMNRVKMKKEHINSIFIAKNMKLGVMSAGMAEDEPPKLVSSLKEI